MSGYYAILFQEEERLGVGHTSEKDDLFFLPESGRVENWKPFVLELRNGDYPDYLASNLGCRLCSERLKGILEGNKSLADVLQWLDVLVRKDGDERKYSVLHFPEPPDVLNKTRTIFAGHFVVKAVLSRDAVGKHRVFAYPKCGCLPLLVSEEVKGAIEAERCTGLELSPMPLA